VQPFLLKAIPRTALAPRKLCRDNSLRMSFSVERQHLIENAARINNVYASIGFFLMRQRFRPPKQGAIYSIKP
jgi:hypothetical protein